jgi:hypothetical protein
LHSNPSPSMQLHTVLRKRHRKLALDSTANLTTAESDTYP